MYKKITLFSTLIIFSFTSAHTIPAEILSTLKEISPQQKHIAEKEKALKDLRTAILSEAAMVGVFFGLDFVMGRLGVANWVEDTCSPKVRNTVCAVLLAADASIGIYGFYKGAQGAKHLLYPDNPNEEESKEK